MGWDGMWWGVVCGDMGDMGGMVIWVICGGLPQFLIFNLLTQGCLLHLTYLLRVACST
jgi:hypothetical protein